MNDIVGPLIVAAISAVTYVAYKHPEAYARIDRWIGRAFAVYVIWLIGFTLGGATVGYLAKPYMGAKADAHTKMIQDRFGDFVDSFAWPILGIMLYSWFLSFLPKLLDLKKDDANREGDNESS